MCQFFSAIITKNGVIYDPDLAHHEDILEKTFFKDSDYWPDFVRVQLLPVDNYYFDLDMANWEFFVLQDLLPEWFNRPFAEKETRDALRDVFSKRFIENCNAGKITDQRIFVMDSSVECYGNCKVKAYGTSHVKAYGQSQVYAYENSHVEVHDDAYAEATGRASIVIIKDIPAEIKEMAMAI
jgi:hypothetical protein